MKRCVIIAPLTLAIVFASYMKDVVFEITCTAADA